MLSGTAPGIARESMKSISAWAPSAFAAPASTPASSIWRKQRRVTAAVGAVVGGGFAKITSAGGLVA